MENKFDEAVLYVEGVHSEAEGVYWPMASINGLYGLIRNDSIRKVVKRNVGLYAASVAVVLIKRKLSKSDERLS